MKISEKHKTWGDVGDLKRILQKSQREFSRHYLGSHRP